MQAKKKELNRAQTASGKDQLVLKLVAVLELTKARLNLSVVYSALAGYLLGADTFSFYIAFLLGLGGYLVVGAANAFNQVIEKDRDALMKRTQNRPLPNGRLSIGEAMIAATLMAFAGLWLLYLINPTTLAFGAISFFLYVLLYTPLKAVGNIAVFAGAFPGAFPALLGWVAATNDFDIEPGILFGIQFLWQFAHFWAIAWICDEDYKAAGYSLLPSGRRDGKSAFQIVLYTFFLVLVTAMPYAGYAGSLSLSVVGFVLIMLLGLGFLYFAMKLFRMRTIPMARKLMIYSIIYLPLVQLIMVLDKYI